MTRSVQRLGAATVAATILVVSLAWTSAAAATTFTVTRFDDPNEPDACLANDCSLREAVNAANSTPGDDVIRAPVGTYSLSIASPGAIDSQAEGDLDIHDDVTIRSIGSTGEARVDANGTTTGDRAFDIFQDVEVTFIGIGAIDGRATVDEDGDNAARGGGIRLRNGATLRMTGGSVTGNFAQDLGGGVFVDRASLFLTRVVVADNKTDFGLAGAIFQRLGLVEVVDSVVRDNESLGFGGAIAGNGLGRFTSSLFEGNDAGNFGGVLFAFGCGSYSFTNSTISGNEAFQASGFRVRNANLFLTFSTVTDNESEDVAGALLVRDDEDECPTEVRLRGTILAGNRDNGGVAQQFPDCAIESAVDLVFSNGHNLVGDPNGCSLDPATGDEIGTHASPLDPGLAPLAFNGGSLASLLTHALEPGSVAVDGAVPVPGTGGFPQTDQRGAPRPASGEYDMGAYERLVCQRVLVNRVGTPGADRSTQPNMAPTSGRDGILGLAGNDSLAGAGANDGLCGGGGNDQLDGGGGRGDRCSGGAGRDSATRCETRRSIP